MWQNRKMSQNMHVYVADRMMTLWYAIRVCNTLVSRVIRNRTRTTLPSPSSRGNSGMAMPLIRSSPVTDLSRMQHLYA